MENSELKGKTFIYNSKYGGLVKGVIAEVGSVGINFDPSIGNFKEYDPYIVSTKGNVYYLSEIKIIDNDKRKV